MSRASPGGTARLWAHRCLCGIAKVLATVVGWLGATRRRDQLERPAICIEAGPRGWDLIEYREIGQSASEYFGSDNVLMHVVLDRRRYVSECLSVVRSARPQRYWVDPRSGSQEPFRAVLQSFALALIFAWYGVTPIAWLADGPNRVWRLQAEVLTARSGIVLVFMHPRLGGIKFAHDRVHGPCIFPLSRATLHRLRTERTNARDGSAPVVSFVGSLYEPRRSRLLLLRESLARRGIELRLITPELTGRRLSNEEYWATLLESDVLVTTADHVTSDGHDLVLEPHFVFRYTEALAAGAALVAPVVRGTEHLLVPGRDYLTFQTLAEAEAQVVDLWEDVLLRKSVSLCGQRTMACLIEHGWFWQSLVDRLTQSRTSP